jgi:hypothetical protein
MLEEIKEVLIKEKKDELERKKKIDNEIKKTLLEIDENDNRTMNEILSIQYEKEALNKKALNRIFNHKKVLELESKIEKLTKENNVKTKSLIAKIESLYQEIYDLSHDEVLVEEEIHKIKQATNVQELGFTEKQALALIKGNDDRIIRAIFKNIKENCNLLTSQDIKKVIAELYKTNVSAFVVAMKKKSLEEILLLLQEADINIGKGKVTFLKNILIEHQTFSIDETNEINNLDYEYYKQVQTELGYMQKSKDYQQTAVSKIITLTALVSIVKANRKKEKETQKGELL